MKKLLLSIVIIVRNNTSIHFLQSLQSIINQTYSEKEIFVIDANKKDNIYSTGLAEDIKKYPDITFLQPDEIESESHIRNYALNIIEGEFVTFSDCYDIWNQRKAQIQINSLLADETAAASCVNGTITYENPKSITSDIYYCDISENEERWLLDKPITTGSQVIYRTELLKKSGGFDNHISRLADLDILMKIRTDGNYKIVFLESLLLNSIYPEHNDYKIRELSDGKFLMTKYPDVFIVNRRIAYDYLLMMIRLAAAIKDPFNIVGYILLSVLKSPFRSLAGFSVLTFRALVSLFTLLFNNVNVIFKTNKLIRSLRYQNMDSTKDETDEYDIIPNYSPENNSIIENVKQAKIFIKYPAYNFANNRKLSVVSIPPSVTEIKKGMFFGCDELVSVSIPNTVQKIGAHAFQNCHNLKHVIFETGSKLTVIASYAFAGCSSINYIRLPADLERFGKGVFAGCANLMDLQTISFESDMDTSESVLSNKLKIIPKYAFFGCCKLNKVVFKPGSMLVKVDSHAFRNCFGLKYIIMTGSLRSLGNYAFAGCQELYQVEVPLFDNIEKIGKYAFYNCKKYNAILIPYVLKRIYKRTYFGCISCTYVKIPAAVERIDSNAFEGCKSLKNVLLMNKMTIYVKSSFPKNTDIDIYDSTLDIYI